MDPRDFILYISPNPNFSAAAARAEGKMFVNNIDPSLNYTIVEERAQAGAAILQRANRL